LQTINHLCQTHPTVTKPLNLWLLGDGKPGHENQSLGLADALARRRPCEVHRVSLEEKGGIFPSIEAATSLPEPDFIIAAGHATHFALLRLARKHRARSIVLMRPSLPLRWFDICIIPAHDFADRFERENVIITQGALNRVSPPLASGREGKMILIGGPSKTHGWDGEPVLKALAEITANGIWQLTGSRRTPDGLIEEIKSRLPGIEIFPHQETTPDWLPARLANAGEVWVTEDSVSMVYEALTSGAKVGLLPVPRIKSDSRVIRGLENLIAENFLTTYADWEKSRALESPPFILREADRCTEEILRRFSL